MRTFQASPASTETHQLAEGPVWDADRDRILWVDIEAGAVHAGQLRYGRVHRTASRTFDPTVGAVVCAADGRLLVARRRDLVVLAGLDTEDDSTPADPVALVPPDKQSRLNDGKCDPAGRFLVGAMALDGRIRDDALYRLELDGRVSLIDADLTLSNGLAWSPDGARMYSIDSKPGILWVRDYGPDGSVGARRELFRIDDGTPDGMCVDTDGNLWIAIWGAGEVRAFTPSGEHVATVHVGPPHTSSVAFVGPELDTLLITTARSQLSPDELTRFPDSGRLYTAQVDARGTPGAPWSGV
jgi:sugar lactone lactonase YvrE